MDKLLTLYEVADYLRLNKFTVYRMVERRELPAIKVANQWRFKEKDLDKWLEENKRFKRKKK
jgi:excisionase family DNA binding protein